MNSILLIVFLFFPTYAYYNYVQFQYSPTTCTILNSDLTFLFDYNQNTFLIHGWWPNLCAECISCGYPQCCNTDTSIYVQPNYTNLQWINQYWYNTFTTDECTGMSNVTLFQHEWQKHITCSSIGNSDNYVTFMQQLYHKFNNNLLNNCLGYDQLWLHLDNNLNYLNLTCSN